MKQYEEGNYFLHMLLFLSLSKFLVVFNISSSHSNMNLPIRRFSQEQFLTTKYSSILHALLHSQSHVLGFHIQRFLQKSKSSNSLHSQWHSLWFHALNYVQFHSIYICSHTIHFELRVLFHLLLTLNEILFT